MADLRVRGLRSREDLEGCVRIQRAVWNHADLDITPVHNLCVSVETGAILLSAFAAVPWWATSIPFLVSWAGFIASTPITSPSCPRSAAAASASLSSGPSGAKPCGAAIGS